MQGQHRWAPDSRHELSAQSLDRPLLSIVDDVHRVAAETAFVLGFIARRVRTDPVVWS